MELLASTNVIKRGEPQIQHTHRTARTPIPQETYLNCKHADKINKNTVRIIALFHAR